MQNTEEDVQVFHRLEIPYGEFRVVVKLPYRVVAEKARARYKDGFLDIELPRQNN
jgi:HSP20 family molecular chaperone IbpA